MAESCVTTKTNNTVVCVGLQCIDIVLHCKSFPVEDSDQRCSDRRLQIGGNAANSCNVLSQLDVDCEFFGIMTRDCYYANYVEENFKLHGISISNCVYHDDCSFPTSTVIINDDNGSRTILHYRKNWPELTLTDFKKLNLFQYSWVHFEGRNVSEVVSMIKWIDSWKKDNETNQVRVSVELEKPSSNLLELLPLGDYVFIGKDFAKYCGCTTMDETVKHMAKQSKPNATIIVPWAELGAVALGPDGVIVRSPGFSPPKVIDTLGAGDTFCAGVICALNSGQSLQHSITFGCKLAGAKVGMLGYEGLRTHSKMLKNF